MFKFKIQMFNIGKKFAIDEYRINRYIPHIYHKKIKCNKASPFLIENFNKKRIKNDYCEYPSYEYDFNMAKTQPNFYNEYTNYKSKSNINKGSEIKENIYLQNIKEEEKKLKILNQNYCENYNDVMRKNIQTYPYGINLNIANIETQELVDIKYNNNSSNNLSSFNKYPRTRYTISKSFTKFASNDIYKVDDNIRKYAISQDKNKDEKRNISFDSHPLDQKNKYQLYKYSKTCSNFHIDYRRKRSKQFKKVKLFINILEEFMIQTIHIFFAFFIHRLKLNNKFKKILKLENLFLLSKKLDKKNSDTYDHPYNIKMINSKNKRDFISFNQKEQMKNNKGLDNAHLKNANTPINLKLNVNSKKHVQFNKNCFNNNINKTAKNIYVSSDIKYNSNQNSNMNLSTAFKSNGFKSTYSKSNYDTKENISNISLTPYKKNIEIFSNDEENSFKNKLSRNRDFSNDELKGNSNYLSAQIIYSKNNTLIYAKPKIGIQKIKKFEKRNNNMKIANNKDSSIKSLIIKKKVIKPLKKSEEIKLNSKYENNLLSEIIVKEIQSIDKRINIFIKYIISESNIKQFTKEKIKRKIISLNKYKNLFLNNEIDILKPVSIESFDLGPVITILKADIKNNENNNNIFLNEKRKEKLINMMNIISLLYQRYIIYFYDFFFYEFQNTDIYNISIASNANIILKDDELNKLNISCISNKINESNDNEIIVDDNYSLNNDIENNLLNDIEKINSTKCIIPFDNNRSDNYMINYIQKGNSSSNNYIKENDKNNVKNKLEKWNYSTLDENKLLRTKISNFKACKSILKNIRIKNDKKDLEKEKIISIRKIIKSIKNKSNNYSELLKKNFEMWRKNISINNRQKKEKEFNYEKKKYPMISENKLEIKNNNKNFNDRKAHDSYSLRKCDSLVFEGLLNKFRNYLIRYFALRMRKIELYDD